MWSFNVLLKLFVFLVMMPTLVSCSFWSPDKDKGSDGGSDNTSSTFQVSDAQFVNVSPATNLKKSSLPSFQVKKNKVWRMGVFNQFQFKICLEEVASQAKIRFKEFSIYDEAGDRIGDLQSTNNEGCLFWKESYFVNKLAPAYYFKMQRSIVGKSLYGGSRKFNVVINPWGDRKGNASSLPNGFIPEYEGELLDEFAIEVLEDAKSIELAKVGQYKFNPKKDGLLFLEDINYTFNKVSGDVPNEYYLELSEGQVFTKVRNVDGEYVNYDLDEGGLYTINAKALQVPKVTGGDITHFSYYKPQFSGKLSNFSWNSGSYPRFFVNSTENNTAEFPDPYYNYSSNGFLKGIIPVHAIQFKESKQLWFLFSITPIDQTFTNYLKELNVVMRGKKFGGGKAVKISDNDHKLFITPAANSNKNLTLGDTGVKSAFMDYISPENNIIVSSEGLQIQTADGTVKDLDIEVHPEMVSKQVKPAYLGNSVGESITNRGIRYSVEPCLYLANGDHLLKNENVEVRVFNMTQGSDINYLDNTIKDPLKKTVIGKTDENGCISVVDEIWYRHYKPEKYLEYKIEINQVNSEQKAVIEYIVNPWDETWTFSQDMVKVRKEFLAANRHQKKIASRIFLPRFSYETLRFSYNIDKYLNLNVIKQVLFNFSATTLRYNSNKSGRFGVYHQRDGIYLVKAAMEKHYLDPSTKGVWVNNPEQICQADETGSTAPKTKKRGFTGRKRNKNTEKKQRQCYTTSEFRPTEGSSVNDTENKE